MTYNVGDKIKIIYMKEVTPYNGRTGVIEHIDDFGQLHGTWGGLAVIPECDVIELVKEGYERNIRTTKKSVSAVHRGS